MTTTEWMERYNNAFAQASFEQEFWDRRLRGITGYPKGYEPQGYHESAERCNEETRAHIKKMAFLTPPGVIPPRHLLDKCYARLAAAIKPANPK